MEHLFSAFLSGVLLAELTMRAHSRLEASPLDLKHLMSTHELCQFEEDGLAPENKCANRFCSAI